jgi:uncharacterized protein (TIGR04255 family)
MERVYNNPPIKEVVCECRFMPNPDWDWTIPGFIYNDIKENFPIKEQVYNIVLQQTKNQDINKNESKLMNSIKGMIFYNKEKDLFVNVSPNRIAINNTKYIGWRKLKIIVNEIINIYLKYTPENKIQRIGLRYYNIIELEQKENYKSFFHLGPNIPESYSNFVLHAFISGARLRFEDKNIDMQHEFVSLPPSDKKNRFGLDIDAFNTEIMNCDLKDVKNCEKLINKWLDDAHFEIERFFNEAFPNITHKELFKEYNDANKTE